MRQCTRCKVFKNENDFDRHPLHSDQLLKQCISCNEKQKTYRNNNYDKTKSQNDSYYKKNRNKVVDKRNERFNTLEGRLKKLLSNLKCKEDIDLDIEYLMELYSKQNGKCALTKIDMVYENDSEYRTHPFMISIDRIDNKTGHNKNNIRLVCTIVNFALNEWGEETFKIICEAYLKCSF